jgi:hypothetical protein
MLVALGHLDYALDLVDKGNESPVHLLRGVELNGRLEMWKAFKSAVKPKEPELWSIIVMRTMKPLVPSLFSADLLHRCANWSPYEPTFFGFPEDNYGEFVKRTLLFVHDVGVTKSTPALEYLVEKMKQEPPTRWLNYTTWAKLIADYAYTAFDFETIEEILHIYSDWKHPLAREYMLPYLRTLRQRIWHYTFVFKAYPAYYLWVDRELE